MGMNKNKFWAIYPKNDEILRTASLGFNFTGSSKKIVNVVAGLVSNKW